MKKQREFGGRIRLLQKLLRIMKLTIFLMVVFALSASANSYSQTTKLNLKVKNGTLVDVLQQIEEQSEYYFYYNNDEINGLNNVTINTEGKSIQEVLGDLLSNTDLEYKMIDRYIVIKKKEGSVFDQQNGQGQKVTGKVVNKSGEPIPGVTVVVKGTTNGTITDSDGNYTLSSMTRGSTLAYSFIGMETQEISYTGQGTVDVTMQEGTIGLQEVVAIGYGTTTVKDATGAISSVRADDFNKGIVASPEQLIQGRSAGVQITTNSGEPGSSVSIRIRGASSIRSGNNPLYVVDGIPLSGEDVSSSGPDVSFGSGTARNPLNFLNPDDIQDISILKDASATAIYGSRGANGVVIITTKSGKGAGGRLDYSSSVGISTISKRYDMLNKEEYLSYAAKLGANRETLDGGANTNWQDQIYRTGISQKHTVSFGNSDQNGDYRVSLNYFDQQGIIKQSDLKRYTVRLNGNRQFFNNKLKLGTQFTVSDIKDHGVPIGNNPNHQGDLVASALYMNPSEPIKNSDGTYNQPAVDQLNPVAMLAYSDDRTNTLRALVSLSAEYQFTKALSFKTTYGYDISKSNRYYAYSPLLNASYIVDNGKGGLHSIDIYNGLWENFLTYNKMFGDKINFSGLAGYSYQSFDRKTSNMDAGKFRFDDVELMMNNIASAESIVGNTSYEKDELQSFYGRINLIAMDKILFTATLRADGSTKFGRNNKYGYFPSLALAYRLSEEDFIPEAISNLKIRLGWGETGNQEIPHNLYMQRQRYGSSSIDGSGNISLGSISNVSFANPDLKWETTKQFNAGIDFGVWSNKLRGSLDYYHKNTTDLLIQVTSAQPAPQPYFWTNLDANIYNSGLEFSLSATAVDQSDFTWDITANASYNKNIVKNFNGSIQTGVLNGQGLSDVTIQRIVNDRPLYAYYLRIFEGFDENGISIYKDGDFPQFTGDSPLPKVTMGLTNTFHYKNFDLNVYLNGQFGHKIYSNTANAFFYAGNLANGKNVTRNILNNGESALNTADPSTRFLEDGSFVRLQDITLGYNIPVRNSKYLSKVRLFVTGQNLAVFTKYSGQDPEVNVNKGRGGVPSFGIDYTTYPRSRTITMGLNVQF
ncbi:MAG TPA: TonB-dependent receptor [Sunxiuqinia sp.]|nr:TonB-dependent receptor [Sunxiuqinia sp.]